MKTQKKKPYIIGVTGYSGSGKSEFCKFLSELDSRVYVIELEELSRQVIYENREKFIQLLGEKVFKPNGSFDYNYYCTCDEDKTTLSRSWRVPKMLEKFYEEVDKASVSHDVIVVNMVSLPRTQIWRECDKRVKIESNEKQRHEKLRIRRFDNCPQPGQAQSRDEQVERSWGTIGDDFQTVFNDYSANFKLEAVKLLDTVIK